MACVLLLAEERRVFHAARARVRSLLGAWHSGWTREKNLICWMARAVRVCASELGLVRSETGEVCGDHLVGAINSALRTLRSEPDVEQMLHETDTPPLTVYELRALIANQPTGVLRLYYDFVTENGRLVVGCFHGYARAHVVFGAPSLTLLRGRGPVDASTSLCLRRMQLERRLDKRGAGEDLEGCLLRWVASQPLDCILFTYRYVLGELWLTQHAPPIVYRPTDAPLILDDVGSPLLCTGCEPSLRAERLYHALTEQYNDVVFHDAVAANVGSILERGLVPAAPHKEVYLWSWALAPTRGRRRHDARFYVSMRRAVRDGGLRFFMSHEGTIICPSPIPMRFLELDEPPTLPCA